MINLPDQTFSCTCGNCQKVNDVSNNIDVFEVKCYNCNEYLFPTKREPKEPIILYGAMEVTLDEFVTAVERNRTPEEKKEMRRLRRKERHG